MKQPNALIHETSPYLLQHAHNPVNWYPWGDAAFQKAGREQKPVFLSIGYSTCHWCHVMERESFEDEEVAALLNRSFVCVKVDKEERPDIDSVYMGVCQAMTGGGGWPLTVLMTPEQKPFFAGTYFPKRRRYGQIGLMELLELVRQKWEDEREALLQSGEQIAAALSNAEPAPSSPPNGKAAAEAAYGQLAASFDPACGGFGTAPKFPMPHQLMFLLRCHGLGVGGHALEMVEQTLTAMYKGGIYDHVGGGFSRYSTDETWLAPHFEKMLYDNALLVMALLECHQVTENSLYKGVAERTLDYIRREMTAPEGGFYSAQDADSEGEEGKYYTFARAEILEVLGPEQGNSLCEHYGVTAQGNFGGKNILNLIRQKAAALPDEPTEKQLSLLLEYRSGRYRLHKDDKILTSWNALMIAACAKAGRVLSRPDYLRMAEKAFAFVKRELSGENGDLLVSYRDGQAKGTGLLEDYAFCAWACLELYESTFDLAYLQQSGSLMKRILSRFSREGGGFYLSPSNGEALIFRPVEQYDGAVPSGNSVAAWCLTRLALLTGEAFWQEAAEKQLGFYGELFQSHPISCAFALTALLQESYETQELLCVFPGAPSGVKALAEAWGRAFLPQASILVKTPENAETLARLAPFTEAYPIGPREAYYLCRNRSCSAPVSTLGEILQMLREERA